MQITFIASDIDDVRRQLWAFLNGPGVVPAPTPWAPPPLVERPDGSKAPAVPAWAPAGSVWVGTPYGPKLTAPDGAEVAVNWMDLSKPA